MIPMKKLIYLQLILAMLLGSCSYAGKKPDKEVQKAFQMRMNGKVDQAKSVLDSILTIDSSNAMACFELARLEHYKLTGGGGMDLEKILQPIRKAVALEPNNVSYVYYNAISSFLSAYLAMETGQGEVKGHVAETVSQFEQVIALKLDYGEAMMYLVEIYGLLPPDMGGDSAKAVEWAKKLAATNGYYGAKAKAVLAPEGTDLVKYWEDRLASDAKNPDLQMEAGKACLFADNLEKAEQYFSEAMASDPSKNILLLDLGRYHIMMVMQNQELAATELPVAKSCFEKYLLSSPEPIIPLKAYTLGLMSLTERFQGNQEEAEKLVNEAEALDPYFSRAMGIPTLLLFDAPDQISHHYFSFFSPF